MPVVRVLVPEHRQRRFARISGKPYVYRNVPFCIGTASPARFHILYRDLSGRRGQSVSLKLRADFLVKLAAERRKSFRDRALYQRKHILRVAAEPREHPTFNFVQNGTFPCVMYNTHGIFLSKPVYRFGVDLAALFARQKLLKRPEKEVGALGEKALDLLNGNAGVCRNVYDTVVLGAEVYVLYALSDKLICERSPVGEG